MYDVHSLKHLFRLIELGKMKWKNLLLLNKDILITIKYSFSESWVNIESSCHMIARWSGDEYDSNRIEIESVRN